MTFLDPTSGLIAAAIAGPALVVLYLLKLRRRPLRISSTLLWEQAIKDLQVNVPFRWLKPSLIFFLQLAALAAFILALARPAIEGPAPVSDQVVIVIDHTASMSSGSGLRPDNDTSRLAEAKRLAKDFAQSLARSSGLSGSRPQIQVISSAAQARIRCAFTSDTRDIHDQIDAIEHTDQCGPDNSTGVAAAINLLESAGAANTGEQPRPRPEVVVFSDAPLPSGAAASLGARLVSVSSVGENATATTSNIGIVAFNARRDAAEPETIRVFARLQNAADTPTKITIRLLVDDSLASARQVEVPPAPADAPLSFSVTRADACNIILTIDDPDLLASDNTAAVHLDAAASPAVLIVAAETGGKPDPDPFFIGAIESSRPRQTRTISMEAYESACADARAERRRPWSTFTLIIFDRVEPITLPPQPTLSFGAGLPIDGLRLSPPPDISLPTQPSVSRFTSWRRTHALLRYVALDPIIIAPAPTGIVAAAAADPSQAGVVALAFGPTTTADDAPIIAGLERPSADKTSSLHRVVVSFSLARSNWGPDHSFPVFISNAIELLTGLGAAATGRSFTTSEPVIVQPTSDAQELLVQAPGDSNAAPTRFTITTPEGSPSQSPPPLSLGIFPRTGIYRLTGAVTPSVCINLLSESETLLPRNASNAVSAAAPSASPPAPSGIEPRKGQREVWHWFLLAGLIIASLEWIIFARGMRA